MNEMKQLKEKLGLLAPVISEICQISGIAGLSLGVSHHGEIVHRANFGYRDLENQVEPDSDTVYPIASLTKAMTAAAFGLLVDEQKIRWDSPIQEIYPQFQQADETVKTCATVVDILAHRTGLAGKNCYWHQSHQKLLLPKHETASTMSLLEKVGNFREDFMYNNWVYGFAGTVLEHVVGESFGAYIQKKIFQPLGLKRTTIGTPTQENRAKLYQTLDDGSSWPVPDLEIEDSTIMGSAGGAKSSVNDLLAYYTAFLTAAKHQSKNNCSSTSGLPFRQVSELVRSHILASASGPNLQHYGLGLVLTELPSTLGLVGLNPRELGSDMPIVGRSAKGKRRVWYHNGSLPGAFSAAFLLPDLDSVIVVLCNSLGKTDTPDWISQLLIESLIEEQEPHDFVKVARQTADVHLSQYPKLKKKIADAQPRGTPIKPLEAYAGRYYNAINTFFIDVAVEGDGLHMWCQGYENVDYLLYHYNHDIFAWEANRDADIKKGIFPKWYEGFHIVKFLSNKGGSIDSLSWGHDGMVPQGEVFHKKKNVGVVDGQHQAPLDVSSPKPKNSISI